MIFLMDTPEFIFDPYMFACFRIASMLGKKELRRVLKRIETFLPKEKIFSRQRYQGLRTLGVIISREMLQSPNTPKFTGWRRHQRVAKGKPPGSPNWTDLVLEKVIEEQPSLDWYELLVSVVGSSLPILGGKFLHLKSSNESETETHHRRPSRT
jgi:hypothetical protein